MGEAEGKTHALRALVALRKKILSGDIAGGTRLLEVALAETLEISRTPVREAMSRLAEEGLLERVASGGFIVRSFSMADVIDAIELRGVLEGTVARLAAERGVSGDAMARIAGLLAQLDACFDVRSGAVDFAVYSDLNGRFHAALSELSGSSFMRREMQRAIQLPFASPSAFLSDQSNIEAFRGSLTIAQEQHRAILAAIEAREGARAEFIAREHARIARRNLEYVMFEDRSLIDQLPGFALLVD